MDCTLHVFEVAIFHMKRCEKLIMLSIRTVPRLIRCLIVSKNEELKLLMFHAEFYCLFSYAVMLKFGKKGNILVQIINLFLTSKKQNNEFTNSRIQSPAKCLLKPLKSKIKA